MNLSAKQVEISWYLEIDPRLPNEDTVKNEEFKVLVEADSSKLSPSNVLCPYVWSALMTNTIEKGIEHYRF